MMHAGHYSVPATTKGKRLHPLAIKARGCTALERGPGGEKKRERRGDSEETREERQIEEGRDRRTKKTEGETIETGGRRERKTQKKNREEPWRKEENRGGRESSRTGGETQET